MSQFICFLVTVLQESGYTGLTTLKCAIKIDRTKETSDWYDYPMEKDSREILHKRLPLHVQSVGPIIDVENIFEITV